MTSCLGALRSVLAALALGFLALPTPGHAQALPNLRDEATVTAKPAPISFAPWQLVESREEGDEFLETFPSPFVSPYPANNLVPLRVFLPAGKSSAPVVLILHYWGATDLKLERTLAGELNRRGVAAAIMTLPYHLNRTPPGYRSGVLAIQADPQQLIQTMTQSVLDVRRALDYLATRPEIRMDHVGICGTSLGAIVTGLAASLDARITNAAFLLGGVDLAHIIWSSSRLVPQRDMMRRHGLTEERLRDALAPIEPLGYLRVHHPQSSFVIGGEFDSVVPHTSTESLISALDTHNVLWLKTGHYGGIFVQRRLMREVATYFGAQFSGSGFTMPTELYAPTLRVGFKIDSAQGFDLGVGIDLVKFNPKGDEYASFLVTPRGPRVFVGKEILPGLSAGIIGSTRTVGAGLFWSTVL